MQISHSYYKKIVISFSMIIVLFCFGKNVEDVTIIIKQDDSAASRDGVIFIEKGVLIVGDFYVLKIRAKALAKLKDKVQSLRKKTILQSVKVSGKKNITKYKSKFLIVNNASETYFREAVYQKSFAIKFGNDIPVNIKKVWFYSAKKIFSKKSILFSSYNKNIRIRQTDSFSIRPPPSNYLYFKKNGA